MHSPIVDPSLRAGLVNAQLERQRRTEADWDESVAAPLAQAISDLVERLDPNAAPGVQAALLRVLNGPTARARRAGSFSAENLTSAAKVGRAVLNGDYSMRSVGPIEDRSRENLGKAATMEKIGRHMLGLPDDLHGEVDWAKIAAEWFEPTSVRKMHVTNTLGKGGDPYGRERPEHLEALDGVRDPGLRSRLFAMRRKLASASAMQKHAIVDSAEMTDLARAVRRAHKGDTLGDSNLARIAAGLVSI